VAVCAQHVAFGDFVVEPLKRTAGSSQLCDVGPLQAWFPVVEFEDYRVTLTALTAWVREQVVEDDPRVAFSQQRIVPSITFDVRGVVRLVVVLRTSSPAFLALTVSLTRAHALEREVVDLTRDSAAVAEFALRHGTF
jgi:hypothetical protein